MSKPTIWLLAGAAFTFTAGAALADPPAAAQRQADEDSAAAGRDEPRTGRPERPERRIYRADGDEQIIVMRGGDRSDHLRTLLQLRPEQDGALKAYLDAVGQGPNREGVVKLDRDAAKTTIDRLAAMEARMADQQAAMRRRIEATKTFYGQLDEKQKKVFDSLPMLMFAGPSFGPMLIPAGHAAPPIPPKPPIPPRL